MQKQPYFIYREGQSALHMAGLYDVWKGHSEELMYSYTILTTDSSEKLTWYAPQAINLSPVGLTIERELLPSHLNT